MNMFSFFNMFSSVAVGAVIKQPASKDPVFREYSQSSKAAVDGMQSGPIRRCAFEQD